MFHGKSFLIVAVHDYSGASWTTRSSLSFLRCAADCWAPRSSVASPLPATSGLIWMIWMVKCSCKYVASICLLAPAGSRKCCLRARLARGAFGVLWWLTKPGQDDTSSTNKTNRKDLLRILADLGRPWQILEDLGRLTGSGSV